VAPAEEAATTPQFAVAGKAGDVADVIRVIRAVELTPRMKRTLRKRRRW
jgi:hypothetical protein